MDAQPLVARAEELDRPDRFGNDERARLAVVQRHLPPEAVVPERDGPVLRAGERPGEHLRLGVEVTSDFGHRAGEVDGHVVSVRHRGGVTLVTVQEQDDTGDVAQFFEFVVEARRVDGVDHPDGVVDDERVAGAVHPVAFEGPTDAAVPAVHDVERLGHVS